MRFKNLFVALLIASLSSLVGCRVFSGKPAGSHIAEVPSPTILDANWRMKDEAALARECPPIDTICASTGAPVFCQVKTYKNKLLHVSEHLSVHASSACAARTEINKISCDLKMVPSQLGAMQCVPDGSASNCPVSEGECDDTISYKTCYADSYGTQVVKRTPGLFGRGINECDARQNLVQVTCKNNLNPELLTEISCEDDPTAGECLNLRHLCTDERKKTLCRVILAEGNALRQEIKGEGDSRCEAMMALHREACSLHLKPSVLDRVICYFNK